MTRKLTSYRSFWTVWLGSAGAKEGTTLFNIQKTWGITTNYLYHREPGLNKPMYKAMKEDACITKEGKRIKAGYGWVPEYVISMHKPPGRDEWSLNVLLLQNWKIVQDFIEKNAGVLFSTENLKTLYGDLECMSRMGPYMFDDIFKLVVVSNLLPICSRYSANIVARIMYTMISMAPGRNLLPYFQSITKQLGGHDSFPKVIENESMLMDVLFPIE